MLVGPKLSKFRRAAQWTVFARNWYLMDCRWQDPFDIALRVSGYLMGKHKPIFDHRQDIGDHVICYNTKELALPEGEWRYRMYYHHSRYAGGRTWAPAYDLHEKDPTLVLYKACYKRCGEIIQRSRRRTFMARLHLFPDDQIPPELIENVVDHIRQLRPVPKALEQFSEEEVKKFPKIMDYPEEYVVK
jgi:large subunit ribosomal protein L13